MYQGLMHDNVNVSLKVNYTFLSGSLLDSSSQCYIEN